MFHFFKKKQKELVPDNDSQYIQFHDLLLQEIQIFIEKSGNHNILTFATNNNQFNLKLDKELSIILYNILYEYSKTENINNIYHTLNNEDTQ